MSLCKRSIRKQAFTVVEVMLAAAVMLAGVVGMIQVVASGSEMIDLSRKQTIATQIIQHQIGKLRSTDWATVSTYSTSTTPTNITASLDASFQSAIASFQSFSCTRLVSDVKTDLKKITFTITWATGNVGRTNYSRTYHRSGSTYVGKNGLYVSYQRS